MSLTLTPQFPGLFVHFRSLETTAPMKNIKTAAIVMSIAAHLFHQARGQKFSHFFEKYRLAHLVAEYRSLTLN